MGVDYRLEVENLDVRGLSPLLKTLNRLFTSTLSDMTTGMTAHDQVRFVMHSPQLSIAIRLPFWPLKKLTFKRILSNGSEFVLGDDIHLNFIHDNMTSGSGNENRKRCGVNLQNRILRKRCFVTIKNKDELCAEQAIVTAIAKLEGFSNYDAYKAGRPI